MHRRPELSIVAPGASAEEAAAVVAALERFLRDTGTGVTASPAEPAPRSAWHEASLHEGVARQPGLLPSWI